MIRPNGFYRQITEADPQDTVATAALINIRGQVDPGAAESRLKAWPRNSPSLRRRISRWATSTRVTAAGQMRSRPTSAPTPPNRTIPTSFTTSRSALNTLRQNKLAAQYYAQAVAAAASRPAGFDRDQAAARLKALQP
jgi:hypothetical protein